MNRVLFSILFFLIAGSASLPLFADTQVSGDVQGEWDLDGSPYNLTDDISIPDDRTLFISSGVQINMNEHSFTISGRLNADGTENDSIYFTFPDGDGWSGNLRFIDSDSLTYLNYCVITGGRAGEGNGELDINSAGGNVFIQRSNVIFENTTISEGYARGFGGGVAIWQSDPIFRNCLISGNYSEDFAGGIGVAFESSPEFTDCRIQNNFSIDSGGGIRFQDSSGGSIGNCLFLSNNSSGSGGGISLYTGANPVIRGCEFIHNNSSAGGGIYIRDEGTSPIIEWNYVFENAANAGTRVGGAFYIRGTASPEIRYNRLIANAADYGGGIYVKESPRCVIHHNLFLQNGATLGGGAVGTSNDLGETPLVLTNCSMINNNEIGLDPTAHTIFLRDGVTININSSIIQSDEPRFNENGTLHISYTNISDGYDGVENSADNPGIFYVDSTWFLLRGDSPCVDSGDPNLALDPDSTRNDRGWLYFPHNFHEGLEDDTLYSTQYIEDRNIVDLRYTNTTKVPIFVTPKEQWHEPEPMQMINLTQIIEENTAYGIAYVNGKYLISGGDDSNLIFEIGGNFELIDTYTQPGNPGGNGFFDLATDGRNVVYGGYHNDIYEFTSDGEFGERYSGPEYIREYTALGVDFRNSDNYLDFYIGGNADYIIQTNGELWETDRLQTGFPCRSLGVRWNRRAIYLVSEPDTGVTQLSLFDIESRKLYPLYKLTPPSAGYRLGGFEVTQDLIAEKAVMVGLWLSDEEDDFISIQEIHTSWLTVLPDGKFLLPGESWEWQIEFAGDQLIEGIYESNFYLTVNDWGNDSQVYAQMESINRVDNEGFASPANHKLLNVYPNPFNSQASYTFILTDNSTFHLGLYDLQGRLVNTLKEGRGTPGEYRGIISTDYLSGGSYFVRLSTDRENAVEKIHVLK